MNRKLHRTDYGPDELRTKRQWAKLKRFPNADAEGKLLYPNYNAHSSGEKYLYYTLEETHEATKEELDVFFEPERAKKRAAAAKRRAKKRAEKLLSEAIAKPVETCEIPSKLICFDVETTGLDSSEDEILQLSIIDGDENVLFNSYIKPYFHDSWESAELIHHISPEMVADSPHAHEVVPKIRGIFAAADTFVSYNGNFDLGFLRDWGICARDIPNDGYKDVMHLFAPIYGVWNSRYGNYTWQKLETCAKYYGYEFEAHDSLEDVKATLYCYRKVVEELAASPPPPYPAYLDEMEEDDEWNEWDEW